MGREHRPRVLGRGTKPIRCGQVYRTLAHGVVAAALALTTLTFPLMNAATRYDAIRYEQSPARAAAARARSPSTKARSPSG
ncbi:hypothetical protein [Spirillospora sp. NPDC047279]|uniref:hypothetical protein n=1 Tax=Spirillospora sp. NPDC047279 TaxID=3155478 RepID=UPI003400813E